MMNRIVDQPVFFRKAVAKMRNQKRQYLVFRMNHGCQISVLIRKPQEAHQMMGFSFYSLSG